MLPAKSVPAFQVARAQDEAVKLAMVRRRCIRAGSAHPPAARFEELPRPGGGAARVRDGGQGTRRLFRARRLRWWRCVAAAVAEHVCGGAPAAASRCSRPRTGSRQTAVGRQAGGGRLGSVRAAVCCGQRCEWRARARGTRARGTRSSGGRSDGSAPVRAQLLARAGNAPARTKMLLEYSKFHLFNHDPLARSAVAFRHW